jgi:hypothetical protein
VPGSEIARFVTVIGGRQVRVTMEDIGPAVADPHQPSLPLPSPAGNGHAAAGPPAESTDPASEDFYYAAAQKFLADFKVDKPTKYLGRFPSRRICEVCKACREKDPPATNPAGWIMHVLKSGSPV